MTHQHGLGGESLGLFRDFFHRQRAKLAIQELYVMAGIDQRSPNRQQAQRWQMLNRDAAAD